VSRASYERAAREAAKRALEEDLAGYGDLAGGAFQGSGRALVLARGGGVLSGAAAFAATAALVDPTLTVHFRVSDGASFAAGDVLAEIAGPFAGILAAERVARVCAPAHQGDDRLRLIRRKVRRVHADQVRARVPARPHIIPAQHVVLRFRFCQ